MLRENVFYHCVNLNKIISLAVIAPYYQSDTFYNVGKNGLLVVPRGAYDSYNSTWMKTGGWHLGQYNWTLQEMQ